MTTALIEVHLTLTENTARKLHSLVRERGLTEEEIIARALELFTKYGDVPSEADYWISVAAMNEDWEAMPDDWMADEVRGAISAR